MSCKHKWEWLIPDLSVWDKDKSATAFVMLIGKSILKRSVFCSKCGRTGHKINSARGGVRLHNSDYFLQEGNKFRKEFDFPLLSMMETKINNMEDTQ